MPGYNSIQTTIPAMSNLIPISLMEEIKRHEDFYKPQKCKCRNRKGKCEDRSCRNVDHMVECGVNCGAFCNNMKLRKGIVTAPIITVNTGTEVGTAVKATEFISKGTVLCEYYGTLKLLSQYEFEHRQDAERKIFAMEHVKGFVIDATDHDHVGRNINHSCKGNCKPLPFFVDDLPRIKIVATRDILQNEYITYNYNLQTFDGMKRFICRCNKTDCVDRGVLLLEKLTIKINAEKPFKCEICEMGFYTRQTLLSHRKRHYAEKSHSCGSCEKKFLTTYELKRHEMTHNRKTFEKYCCPLCPRIYQKKFNRDHHVKQHVGRKISLFKCPRCDVIFYFNNELKKHMAAGGPLCKKRRMTNLYACPLCNVIFGWKVELQKHLRLNHKEYRPYKCSQCDMSYQTLNGVEVHKLVRHGVPRYECTECYKRFHFPHKLKRHQQIHDENRKKITCPIIENGFRACGKSYSHKNLLLNHVNTSH